MRQGHPDAGILTDGKPARPKSGVSPSAPQTTGGSEPVLGARTNGRREFRTGRPCSAQSTYETIDTVAHTYHIVETQQALEALRDRLAAVREFCFDTETTGFDVFGDRLVGISVAVEPHEAWYIPCNPENTKRIIDTLRPVFEDERIAKIGQNVKFDIMMLRSAGTEVRGMLYDTMIIHYLLDPESRHGMDHLARTLLNYSPVPIEELIGKGVRQITMDRAARKSGRLRRRRRRRDAAAATAPMAAVATGRLEELYRTIEEPLIRVLADIEMTGVKIDAEARWRPRAASSPDNLSDSKNASGNCAAIRR